jgi:threonine synthase
VKAYDKIFAEQIFMAFNAWFQCFAGCEGRYPLNEVVYRCRTCGGLLEVVHDLNALRQARTGASWMQLFDQRYMRTEWPYGSGVWGKKEWVAPTVAPENVVSLFEGGTNLFWADRLGRLIGLDDLWIKQCGNSHTGSFKDIGMTVLVSMVKQMIADGRRIRGVACASTGDTSAALAAYCAVADLPAMVFLPRGKVTDEQLIQPVANGAITVALDTDFDGCMKMVAEFCARNDIYLANSMNSLRIEGQKTISLELVQQFDWQVPDWVIVPGGNLGNMTAIGKGFLMMQQLGLLPRLPKLCVAQAAKANPLYESYLRGFDGFSPKKAEKTLANAIQIGDPVNVRKAIQTLKLFGGIVEQATEQELADAAAAADWTGLFSCPHTGVALAALFKLVRRGDVRKGERVVVISTAHGLKFTGFKRQYHLGRIEGVEPAYRNGIVELPNDYEAVRGEVLRKLDARKTFRVAGFPQRPT